MKKSHTAYRTPHTAYHTPHTAYHTPHTAYRTPHTAYRIPHTAYRNPQPAYRITLLPQKRDIVIQNLTFQYDGQHSEIVLNNIHLEIPSGKITAIVGMSGSGKTTLVKLMLGFYPPLVGEIKVGEYNL